MNNKDRPIKIPKNPFAYVAFWQLMTFIILILLVWINELRDGAAVFFEIKQEEFNIFRAFVLTACILVVAVITIGNTYLQQQRVLQTMISVCSSCHRVRINDAVWQRMEEYIGERSLLNFTHGLCPECLGELLSKTSKL